MSHALLVEPFSAARLADVRNFVCGKETFEAEVSDWIKGPVDGVDTALRRIANNECEVWLYRLNTGVVVGFSSLGWREWNLPKHNDPKRTIAIIPNLAVHASYQGKIEGCPIEMHYASQIFGHLLQESLAGKVTMMGLHVHVENKRARKFYEKKGFVYLDVPGSKSAKNKTHLRMFTDLSDLATALMPSDPALA